MENIVGYCAIVMPSVDHYQAYFIQDTPDIREDSEKVRGLAIAHLMSANPFGTLQAAFAEGALRNHTGVVATISYALREVSGDDYFYVLAHIEAEGTRTSLHRLDATSVDEARALIEKLPEVLEIKERLLAKLSMRDGSGRMSAFH